MKDIKVGQLYYSDIIIVNIVNCIVSAIKVVLLNYMTRCDGATTTMMGYSNNSVTRERCQPAGALYCNTFCQTSIARALGSGLGLSYS